MTSAIHDKATITPLTREFGKRLRLLRGDKSTRELSKLFATTKKNPEQSTSADSWREWEKGRVPWFAYNTLVKIARYFDVSTDWLLGCRANEELYSRMAGREHHEKTRS